MAAYELFSESDLEQCPCEFCDELFPFEILIEHQSGCRPDVARYNFDEDVDSEDDLDKDLGIQDVIVKNSPPKQVQAIEPDKSTLQTRETKTAEFKDLLIVAKESIKESVILKEKKQKSPPSKEFDKLSIDDPVMQKSPSSKEFEKLSIEDPVMQETGIKLMTYGSNTNKNKQVENEKPSFKTSISLLNNADQKEVDDGCHNISDDEEGESLEDFWKRAEIFNYQRLKKIKAVNAF